MPEGTQTQTLTEKRPPDGNSVRWPGVAIPDSATQKISLATQVATAVSETGLAYRDAVETNDSR